MNARNSPAFERLSILNGDRAVEVLTMDEERESFDQAAHYFLNFPGDGFLPRWESREFREDEKAGQPASLI